MATTLNILQLCRRGSRVLGPGLRYVIWVQGCPFRCPHCETPEGQPFGVGNVMDIEDLYQDIVSRPEIQGVTFSGGEPFEQASALAVLASKLKASRPELTFISYTGYSIEQLTSDDSKSLLSNLDVLIDGRYVHELNDDKGLRGSSNQRVHFLTGRLEEYRDLFESGKRNLEVVLHGKEATIIGLTKKDAII